MNKVFAIAGAIALSIIPTPSFSGEVEQKEMMSVTEQLLPQIGEKYNNLDIKEKKAYKQNLIEYLENVQKTGATGVGVGVSGGTITDWNPKERKSCNCGLPCDDGVGSDGWAGWSFADKDWWREATEGR